MTEPKFMTPAHRRAYLTHLNRCKAMDSYHRALIYILTAVPALRNRRYRGKLEYTTSQYAVLQLS